MVNMHSILSDFNMSFTYHMKNLVKVIYLSYEKLSEVLWLMELDSMDDDRLNYACGPGSLQDCNSAH